MTFSKFITLLLAVATAGLVSCASTTKDVEISKVKYYKLTGKKGVISADPAISFEQKYYLHGAVSNEDIAQRVGVYYTIHWSVADTTQPVKLVLSYRQSKTGSALYTKEIVPDVIKRSNNTEFSVIGDEFAKNGHVTAWKVAIVRGKEEVATHKSYLWE